MHNAKAASSEIGTSLVDPHASLSSVLRENEIEGFQDARYVRTLSEKL